MGIICPRKGDKMRWSAAVALPVLLASHLFLFFYVYPLAAPDGWIFLDLNRYNEGNLEFLIFVVTFPFVLYYVVGEFLEMRKNAVAVQRKPEV